jgi:hypothetical protein
MVHRRELHHPGLHALSHAVDQLAAEQRWHNLPDDPWLAENDRRLLDEL